MMSSMKRTMLQIQRLALATLGAGLLLTLPVLAPAQQSYPEAAGSDEAGFVQIFDGKTLDGWEGDPKYWRVENGSLTGEVTPETVMKQNSFIIWRGGVTRDFELKVEYRVSAHGNSGINYRSVAVPGVPWAVRGYQFDIDGQDRNQNNIRHTGQNYEERGRTFMALRGQVVRAEESGERKVIGSVGDIDALKSFIKSDNWNEIHIIARGNVLTHMLNGQVMSIVVDEDPGHRKAEGLLGVQVHVGPPMKIEYRNFRLKNLN
jgi:3-keto-disaccharide hydrolase